ncbi:c-type cytochrome [Paenibacillus sp. OAS669]|uniref:c-type cytochrome n=1 Tax=Paenibacillus sp. OAS669 TaxID=2663821 RepID=UPI0019EB72D0|nr:cytochrome c [Paenibacillus sp. OAS669]MBE1443046.1 cytochrome c551 [Paenibacillus sp. OAS669]
MKVQMATIAALVTAAIALSGCNAKSATEGQAPPAASSSSQVMQPQGSAAPASPSPTPAAGGDSKSSSATAVNAESLVKQNCIACHGDTLDGKGSEKKNLQKIGSKMNQEQLVNQITNGGGGMPGFKSKLKEEEITAIAAWLEAKK